MVNPDNGPDAGAGGEQGAGEAVQGGGVVGVFRAAEYRWGVAVSGQGVGIGRYAKSRVAVWYVVIGAQSRIGSNVVRAWAGASHDLSAAKVGQGGGAGR